MKTDYETDVVAWANEQAAFVRAGRFDMMDLEHIAEEIEDVGKSEQRELSGRLAILLAHLLKWKYQPERRGNSWKRTIKVQRLEIDYLINESPSLKRKFDDEKWISLIWEKAIDHAISETNLEFPETYPWDMSSVLTADWLPE